MSDLENCLNTIIQVFHKYSEREGNHSLKKSELKELLTHELPSFTQ
ncbi:protein S100-B, partial [Tachysurus ichikawai]